MTPSDLFDMITRDKLLEMIHSAERSRNSANGKKINRYGASVLTKSMNIFSGCSFSASSISICAERIALYYSFAQGEWGKDLIALVLTYQDRRLDKTRFIAPCGVCLQTIHQLTKENEEFPIFSVPIFGTTEKPEIDLNNIGKFLLGELLPHPF